MSTAALRSCPLYRDHGTTDAIAITLKPDSDFITDSSAAVLRGATRCRNAARHKTLLTRSAQKNVHKY